MVCSGVGCAWGCACGEGSCASRVARGVLPTGCDGGCVWPDRSSPVVVTVASCAHDPEMRAGSVREMIVERGKRFEPELDAAIVKLSSHPAARITAVPALSLIGAVGGRLAPYTPRAMPDRGGASGS